MPFIKGKSGNPGGRPKDKPWVDALRIAANATDAQGIRKLRRIAEKTIELALAGDMAAIKEIGDRLDGKPAQAIIGDPDHPLQVVSIERVIVDPAAAPSPRRTEWQGPAKETLQ